LRGPLPRRGQVLDRATFGFSLYGPARPPLQKNVSIHAPRFTNPARPCPGQLISVSFIARRTGDRRVSLSRLIDVAGYRSRSDHRIFSLLHLVLVPLLLLSSSVRAVKYRRAKSRRNRAVISPALAPIIRPLFLPPPSRPPSPVSHLSEVNRRLVRAITSLLKILSPLALQRERPSEIARSAGY